MCNWVIPTWEKFIEESETLNATEQSKDSNINYFVNDYFCKQYIGEPKSNGQRKRAPFPIELWNVHESTFNGIYNFRYMLFFA